MDHHLCVICYDDVFLPVEIVCFTCFRIDQIHCCTFLRICIQCAHTYLQLDRSSSTRDFFRKCLFCNAYATIHNLSISNAYRIDFFSMSKDHCQSYTCPFCRKYRGNQISIVKHLQKDCPDMLLDCECGVCMPRRDYWFHLESCPLHHLCPHCHEYIHIHRFNDHCRDVHEMSKCSFCNVFVRIDLYEHHLTHICPNRLVSCEICNIWIRMVQFIEHMEEHEQEAWDQIKSLKSRLLDWMQTIRRIQDLKRRLRLV